MHLLTGFFVRMLIGFLVLILSSLPPVLAVEKKEANILVLFSYHQTLPWYDSFMAGLRKAQTTYENRVHLYIESMEAARLDDSMSDEEWVSFLAKKYKFIKFDAAIAESEKASEFLNQNGALFLGDVPHVYYTEKRLLEKSYTNMLQTRPGDSTTKTFQIALRQNPLARQIVIIDGQDLSSRPIVNMLLELVEQNSYLNATILKNFTLSEIKAKVSELPPDTIIFYTLIFKDRAGKQFVPKEALSGIAEVSVAPIYSFWSSLMGSGIVGGHMVDGATAAQQMVKAVMDYLENGEFQRNYNMLRTFMDWGALSRYGIDTDLIPKGSVVINKPPPLLESYFQEVVFGALLVGALILAVTLYWLRKVSLINKELQAANNNVLIAKIEAEKLARTDMLTGMNNRRAFFDLGEQAYKQTKRLNESLSVLLLDIDNFKRINDTYGHAAGDEVIKAIARIIEKSKREIDVSARYGGEEFVIVTPFTDILGAKNLADRIRDRTEHKIVEFGDDVVRFTVSIGVFGSETRLEKYSLSDALTYADEALYKAKVNGKNQVVVYDLKAHVHDMAI